MSTARIHQAIRHPWPVFGAALVLVVVGFWPSFFAKLPDAPLPHHVHAWSATGWMILPLLQYGLIRSSRRSLHRLVGYSSVLLAAVVAVSGVYVVRMMAYTNIASFRLASVKFVWLDLTGIAFFCIYVAIAISAARRRDIRLHVTALAASAFIPLEAALERLFVNGLPSLIPDFDAALYASLILPGSHVRRHRLGRVALGPRALADAGSSRLLSPDARHPDAACRQQMLPEFQQLVWNGRTGGKLRVTSRRPKFTERY